MKKSLQYICRVIFLAIIICIGFYVNSEGQTLPNCITDTTGGYISIFNPKTHNPICNYELLTNSHLIIVHQLKIDRAHIPFFPHSIDVLYSGSGDSRGHVIPFEDLAWSQATATASMDENRNLAPEPQSQNIGTELAKEDTARLLATQHIYCKVYGGTFGTLGDMKGINKPAVYWSVLISDGKTYVYWMSLTGDVGFHTLGKCHIAYSTLVSRLGFDPVKVIGK